MSSSHNSNLPYLAGFLHDIGKLYQRADAEQVLCEGKSLGRFKKPHEEYSTYFIQKHLNNVCILRQLSNDDLERLKEIVRKHHDKEAVSELIYADRVDAGEREFEEKVEATLSTTNIVLERLRTPFIRSELDIYGGINRESSLQWYSCFRLEPLDPSKQFWSRIALNKIPKSAIDFPEYFKATGSYVNLLNRFEEFLRKYGDLIANIGTLDFVLKTFLWSVPVAVYSGQGKYIPTISLYHHSKIVAALTAIRSFVGERGALLIGGDISGIQRFISRVSRARETDLSGVAKRLRGRSTFIELLLEGILLALITHLGLNLAHVVYVGGGNFYVVAPNSDVVKLKLEAFEQGIQRYLLSKFNGELGFVFDYVEVSFDELTKTTGIKLNELKEGLERKKKMKFSKVPLQNIDDEYEGEICRSCSIRPARTADRLCNVCKSMQEIGGSIVKTIGAKSLIVYLISKSRSPPRIERIGEVLFSVEIFQNLHLHVVLIPEVHDRTEFYKELIRSINLDNAYRVYIFSIRDTLNFMPDPKAFLGALKNESELDKLHKIVFGWTMINNYAKLDNFGNIMSLDDLAKEVEEGPQYLAYIKADVDYAGFLFSKLITLSQFMSLSFLLEIFFAGFIPNYIMRKYPNSYVIFGGGDDLFLIMAWDKAPQFLIDLLEAYKELTIGRSTLSLSFNLFRPKYPVRSAYNIMIQNLDEAKPKYDPNKPESLIGGNVYIFNTIAKDHSIRKLIEFGEELTEYIKNGKLPRTLLFRIITLIKYVKPMCEAENTSGKLNAPVIWWPRLLYILRKLKERHPEISEKILDFCSSFRTFCSFLIPATLAFLKTKK